MKVFFIPFVLIVFTGNGALSSGLCSQWSEQGYAASSEPSTDVIGTIVMNNDNRTVCTSQRTSCTDSSRLPSKSRILPRLKSLKYRDCGGVLIAADYHLIIDKSRRVWELRDRKDFTYNDVGEKIECKQIGGKKILRKIGRQLFWIPGQGFNNLVFGAQRIKSYPVYKQVTPDF